MVEMTLTVQKVLYPKNGKKSDTGFCMFKATRENGESLTCKGSMSWLPNEMETLAVSGDYVIYKGERQFQFKSVKLTLPLESRSQLNYVCERAKGIGPAMADQIWNLKQEEWRKLQAGEIKKLTGAAFDNFREQITLFDCNKEKAEVISWLEGKGCSTAMADAAFETWGTGAPGIVNSDCYRLAELPRFSFKSIDENVRINFGIADNDQRRIKAAAKYSLQMLTSDGSTAINAWMHYDKLHKLLPEIENEMLVDNVREMMASGQIKMFSEYGMIALDEDYQNETLIHAFTAMSDTKNAVPELSELINKLNFRPDETQTDAVRFALSERFSIINGGAGTGKTTIIKLICDAIRETQTVKGIRLCAFAAKAAARLREATKHDATTIHLMLGYDGNSFQGGSLDGIAVIVDEASMVNAELMAQIMKRNPAKLILVGDQAQLSPVGAGQPFHDIIANMPEKVKTLKTCYRNTEAVFQAATMIRNGELPKKHAQSENERWTVCVEQNPAKLEDVIAKWVESEYINFEEDIILCPKNGESENGGGYTPATVNSLNRRLLAIDRARRGLTTEFKFEPGDRVINTKNNAELQIWNGTTGTVQAVNTDGGIFLHLDTPVVDKINTIDLKNPIYTDMVRLEKEDTKNLQYAYAMTVHKAQGSQYRNVVIVCLTRDVFMLDRSLIYTAVTRTRKECTVAGDFYALGESIKTIKKKDTVLQLLFLKQQTEEESAS